MNQIRISKGLSFYKKQSSVFMLIVAISFASNVKADDIAVTSVKSGAATGSAKCNYPGEENETNDEGVEIAGGAFAGSIELEVRNNKVTKLDSKIAGTSCRVSLGAFKQQIQPNTHNIVLKNSDDCSVVIGFNKESVVGPDGVSRGGSASNLKHAVMSFGVVAVEGGGCEKLCPEMKAPKKYWTIIMNPRTNECSH